ncbi:MAG: bifunctional ADP-dependent NAD(P)H-hydrate dehydratase/NAD(P)H-hydrate epimerase [Candidatus Altiarchaeales archaeon HGW-Altiarchaeales-3]|nr:MAG: bifunctional ADP-dependent NAD(P)H-hydrate dehydratase/NAD(P)H-hydrate epimerase [Candidatus Altiarchaeales archaeon HGW-Altiarchaeales-3]
MPTPEQLARISDINSAYLGIDTLQLMENAGSALAREINNRNFKKIAFFCGAGNNGGDGLVAARHLSGPGKEVRIYMLRGDLTREAGHNFNIIKNCNFSINLRFIRDSTECEKIKDELKNENFDCVVDALIGVGIYGELREPIKSLVEVINKFQGFKVAVDVPTGDKVNADLILSFHLKKHKNCKVANIGIPEEGDLLCGPGDVYLALPKRSAASHKGNFGRLLIIGGSKDYIGAPILADSAARRTGVDLIFLNCPGYVADRQTDPNLIINSLDSKFYINSGDIDKILNKFKDYDAIVVGNGIGTKDETKEAMLELLERVEKDKIIVIDADALKLITPGDLGSNIIVTPHLREFKILFNEKVSGKSIPDKIKIVESCAYENNTTIVLKGATDIISNGKETKLNKTGNPGMTVGGTGDVLAGIIGGLASQNKAPFISACAGTFLCGIAGDIAHEKLDFCFKATDVIDCIPDAVKFCRKFF